MAEKWNIAVDELHNKAMELADKAFYAKRNKESDLAQSKYLEAFIFESAAAQLLVNEYDKEPTRSVLYRSAASLLLNLPFPSDEHVRNAERMVAFGLSGNPPEEIAIELREIWYQVRNLLQKKVA